jgi:hypothetical protein
MRMRVTSRAGFGVVSLYVRRASSKMPPIIVTSFAAVRGVIASFFAASRSARHCSMASVVMASSLRWPREGRRWRSSAER